MGDFKTLLHEALRIFCFESVIRSVYQTAKVIMLCTISITNICVCFMTGFEEQDTDLFLCDTNTCKFDGECLRIGDTVTCICDFKCSSDYAPVCGSNGESYENHCLLRKDACKLQTEVLLVSDGACPVDAGSGSGDDVNEGSAEISQKETSTCDICQFGAECDEDSEDV
ncbi:hypothetical protein ABG768_023722, partial [Culter alburnus]